MRLSATAFALVLVLATAAWGDDAAEPARTDAAEPAQSDNAAEPAPTDATPVDRAEFERLRERVRTLEREAAEAKGAEAPAASGDFRVRWDDGVRFTTNDGRFDVKLGARVDVDAAFFETERDVERYAPNGADVLGDFDDAVAFRRARPELSGTLFRHVIFKLEIDFQEGEALLRDVYVGAGDVPVLGDVLVGHFREFVGLDAMTATSAMTFMERSLPFALTPGRNVGVGFRNAPFDRRTTFALGAFWATDDQGRSEDEEAWSLTGRATVLPLYEDDGRFLLHLGAAYSHRFFGDDEDIRYRSRPESQLAEFTAETPRFGAGDVDLVGGEAALVLGPVSVQGEYVRAFNRGEEVDPEFSGWSVLGSWFVTGEHRGYKKSKGAFDMPEIRENFWDGTEAAGCGAWELAARFSSLDLNDRDEGVRGGELSDVSVGVNWYWNPNFRLMANWVHAHAAGVGDVDVFQTRAQLDF